MITIKETKAGRVFMTGNKPLLLNKGSTYKIHESTIVFKEVHSEELVKKLLRLSLQWSLSPNLKEVYNEILLLTYEYEYMLSVGGYIYESGKLFDKNLGNL